MRRIKDVSSRLQEKKLAWDFLVWAVSLNFFISWLSIRKDIRSKSSSYSIWQVGGVPTGSLHILWDTHCFILCNRKISTVHCVFSLNMHCFIPSTRRIHMFHILRSADSQLLHPTITSYLLFLQSHSSFPCSSYPPSKCLLLPLSYSDDQGFTTPGCVTNLALHWFPLWVEERCPGAW